MLELATLLWVDNQYPAVNAVPDCLGDRYLYCNNKLFARIRDVFLSFGYNYTTEANGLWRDYDSAPFFVLQDFLHERVVPYKDNFRTLSRVSLRNPRLEISGNSLLRFVNRNYLLHESAHCISYAVLPAVAESPASDNERVQFVLKAVACEAFANVIERMAHAYAEQPAHVLFLHLNSYVEFSSHQRRLLRDSISLLGLENVFRLGFLIFLYLNTHGDEPDEQAIRVITDIAFQSQPLSPIERHIAAILAQAVFTLSKTFRDETSSLFFRIYGCEEQYRQSGRITFSDEDMLKVHDPWIHALSSPVFSGFEDLSIAAHQPSTKTDRALERAAAVASK